MKFIKIFTPVLIFAGLLVFVYYSGKHTNPYQINNTPSDVGQLEDGMDIPQVDDTQQIPEESSETSGTLCEKAGGIHDATHRECLGIDGSSCIAIGGNWNECASACRHDPDAQICTMQCELVCEL